MNHRNKVSQPKKRVSAPIEAQTSPSHRILVVDGEPFIRQLNIVMLLSAGYQVEGAEDGAVAWDNLRSNTYDLLVTDNNMPKVSGLELLRKLHASGVTLPVIMATGTLPTEEFTRSPWLQPTATLQKPYNTADLLGTVEEVLRALDDEREQLAPCTNGQNQRAARVKLPIQFL